MKLSVEQIGEDPRSYDFRADPDWWASRELDGHMLDALTNPVFFHLTASRLGSSILLEGRVEASLDVVCSRCLERYRHPVREPFRLVLEPAGDRVPSDPEGARQLEEDAVFLSDELEYGWFRKQRELSLGTFFAELVALVFPVQPLCREDCQGLCPRCGANRNEAPCSCEESASVSPFSALADLRERLRQTEGEEK